MCACVWAVSGVEAGDNRSHSNCKSSLRQFKLFAQSQVHVRSPQQEQQQWEPALLCVCECVAGQGAHLRAFSDKPRPRSLLLVPWPPVLPCNPHPRAISLSASSGTNWNAISQAWPEQELEVRQHLGVQLGLYLSVCQSDCFVVLYQLLFWQYAKCAKAMRQKQFLQVIFMMMPHSKRDETSRGCAHKTSRRV